MKIEELNENLKEAIEHFDENWNKNQDVNDCFPEIVEIALDEFREAIVEYLKENK